MEKSKRHSLYNWRAKNYGRDLIYQTRLRLAEKLKIKSKTAKMYCYLLNAELGIILY
jgi:hypothetical protein